MKLWWAKAWVRPSVHIYVISLKPWPHILCNTKIISCKSLSLAPFILIWGDHFPGSLQMAFIHQQQCLLRPCSLYASWFDFHALHSGLKHPYESQQILLHVNSTEQLMHCHFQGQKTTSSLQTDRKQAQNNPSHIINQAIQATLTDSSATEIRHLQCIQVCIYIHLKVDPEVSLTSPELSISCVSGNTPSVCQSILSKKKERQKTLKHKKVTVLCCTLT